MDEKRKIRLLGSGDGRTATFTFLGRQMNNVFGWQVFGWQVCSCESD